MGDTGFNFNRMIGSDPTGQHGAIDLSPLGDAVTRATTGFDPNELNAAKTGFNSPDTRDMTTGLAGLLTGGLGLGAMGVPGMPSLAGLGSADWGGIGGNLMDWGGKAWDITKGTANNIQDILDVYGTFSQLGGGQGQEMPNIQDIYGDISSPGSRGSLSQIYNLGGEGGSDNIYGGGTDPKLMALIAALMSQGKGKKTIS